MFSQTRISNKYNIESNKGNAWLKITPINSLGINTKNGTLDINRKENE